MIKRINQILNVGKFESFSSNVDFDKNNIIFGFNGAGKSTLSDIFYSLAHKNKESLITRRVTLKRDENEPVKQIYIKLSNEDGNYYDFDEMCWTNTPNNIFVFNDQYVEEHVFVSKELKGNTVPIGMGANGVKYMSQRELLNKEIASLINDMNNNIDVLHSSGYIFKDVTASKITQRTNSKRYNTIAQFELYTPSQEKIMEEKIKSHTKYSKEIEDIKKCHELYLSISGLKQINKSAIIKTVSKVPHISSKEIANYLANTLTTTDIKWAVQGYRIQKDESICPLCGQAIADQRAKEFFNKLGRYVNQHKDDTVKTFCYTLNNIAGLLNSIDIQTKIHTFNEIIQILDNARLIYKKDVARLVKGLSWTNSHSLCLENIVEKIYKKAENPYTDLEFTIDENQCLTLLNSVIKNIYVLGEIIITCEDRLNKKIDKNLSFDEMSMRFELSFGSCRKHMENLKSQAYQMNRLISRLDNLNKQIDDCYNQIQLDIVNKFLSKLNTNIKIEVSDKKYFICLRNFLPLEYAKEKDYSIFSEGEQRAIAFAYFLSELSDFDAKNNKRIIVIDDPISSMDLCRKSIISYQIAEFMKEVNNQIFILSHDMSFIEKVTNFASHTVSFTTFELNVEKRDFMPLDISDYLTTDEKVYSELISAAQKDHSELAKILALISLRPFAYVKKVPDDKLQDVFNHSTFFSHTLYSKNSKLKYRPVDYSSSKLKEYINLVNGITGSSFDAESIVGNYNFNGFDFNTLVDLYLQIPLNNIHDARKKALLMRPLIEACFFQLSQREKFDPENIGQMYKKTLRANKANSFKYAICEELYELYNSSKKYHHGADDGSSLGISWINPNEIDFYNAIMESIIQKIQSLGSLRTVSA